MDDSSATTPSPSSAAATTTAYDAARNKTNDANASTTSAVDCEGGRGSSGIQLLIKSSNQQYDDMNIESDLCWTVQRLKKQLSLVYPGKPKIKDQKLIYSGKLLDDAQKLSEVIRSYKDVYQQHHIFHLVCANRIMAKAPHQENSLPKNASSMTTVTTNTTDNELRHRGMVQPNGISLSLHEHNQNNQMPGVQAAPTSASASESATNAQIAFHQHQAMLYNAWLYQWYTIYMQQAQRASGSSAVVPPTMPPFLQNFPHIGVPFGAYQPVAPAEAAATVAPPGAPNAAAVAQPAAREADGPNFPNIQEEPEVRDWLDSFFSFTRLAIFVTLLYLNSSPMRCLMVVLIASGIYLYHICALRRRRERNNNNINRNNNAGNNNAGFGILHQNAPVDNVNDDEAEARGADDAEPAAGAPGQVVPAAEGGQRDGTRPAADSAGTAQADGAVAAAEAVAVDPANANNSVVSIVRTIVITFFTSLLPEATAL